MSKARCTECGADIVRSNPREGALLVCPECSVELEIIGDVPFEVDYPFDNDWD